MKNLILYLSLTLVTLSSCSQQTEAGDDPLLIPYCDRIEIDGSGDDWADKGLHIPLVVNLYGESAPGDFSASLKLAWDTDNIYFLVEAEDDQLLEKAGPLQGDGMEIFISQERGTNKMVQYIIAPGLTEEYPAPRVDKYDYIARGPESDVEDVTIMTSPAASGYTMEGMIPFNKTGIQAAEGRMLALNLYLSDVDPDERKTRYALYFNQDTWSNHFALREMILDGAEDERSVSVMVKAFTEDRQTHRIRVVSETANVDKVYVRDGFGYKKRASFREKGGIYIAEIDIPIGEIDTVAAFLQLEYMDSCRRKLYLRDFSQHYVNTERPNRWEDYILLYEEKDKLNHPQSGGAVFIGSSSIRLWDATIKEDFQGYNVICRGFGGSTTGDALHYFDRVVAPYEPSVIVIAEGSNDLGQGDTPKEVVDLTEDFILKAAEVLPEAKVLVMSVKVSVTRKRLVETVMETNSMLQEMISRHENAGYVDVVSEMLRKDGKVRAEIFSADSTHMNAAGYAIWTRIMHPYLESIYPQKGN